MDRRQLPAITDYLQDREVQERIQQKIGEVRTKATVTISRAAELFDFTENKLRDWEKRGLLSAERAAKQDGKGKPHRQYTPTDLDKLAVIQALLDSGYSLSDLENEVEAIWQAASKLADKHTAVKEDQTGIESLPVDRRIEGMNEESAWRYFISQALRLSLMLICEEMPDTTAGLVLPLYKDFKNEQAPVPAQLRNVGPALLGWLEPNQPFCTFLDPAPHFEYDTDFRLHKLLVMEANVPQEDAAQDSTLIVVQRKAKPLTLTPMAVETIRGLLALVYQNIDTWKPCFDYGMRDWVYHGTNFVGETVPTDVLLKGLTNMVVALGGKTTGEQNRWNFCCILLPKDNTLPIQQRTLAVRAQSDTAPHTLETTVVSPKDENPGLSLKAFQSGHSFYHPDISPEDPMIAYRTKEGPIRSAIAIPISGEGGISAAVMYVTANEAHAFSERDQRLLRMMSRMVEELLATYTARQWFERKLTPVLAHPELVDPNFDGFLSEGDFIRDVETLLEGLREKMGRWEEPVRLEPLPLPERAARFWADEKLGVVSFIAIDIDNQSGIASKYGDLAARNLAREVGVRIQREISLFEKSVGRKLYHVCADRFYLLLNDILLEDAQGMAVRLKQALRGNYILYMRSTDIRLPILPDSMMELKDITVRTGISVYTYLKLEEVLRRYPATIAVSAAKTLIVDSINGQLNMGRSEGSDVIISWNPKNWRYERWDPH